MKDTLDGIQQGVSGSTSNTVTSCASPPMILVGRPQGARAGVYSAKAIRSLRATEGVGVAHSPPSSDLVSPGLQGALLC